MQMMINQWVLRGFWLFGLILQAVIYILSFSSLLRVVASQRLPVSPILNMGYIEALAVLFWFMLLWGIEDKSISPRWARYLLIAAGLFVTSDIVRLHIAAWIVR